MDKCKWENGKFEPCEGFNGYIKLVQEYGGKWKCICESCHTDIRKPTHEEIMTKWWVTDTVNGKPVWKKVYSYLDGYYTFDNILSVKEDWFIDIKSADMPPK